jgi:hypothetical protein
MPLRSRLTAAIAGLAFVSTHPLSAAEPIQLIARGQLSGTERDLSGLVDDLGPDLPHNRLGGFSALEYTGQGNRYLILPDRGPGDGAFPFRCRLQVVDLTLDQKQPGVLNVRLESTSMLLDANGESLTGHFASGLSAGSTEPQRFDPEGLRIAPGGELLISEEYGPSIHEFSKDGQRIRNFAIPARYLIANPSPVALEEARNTSGRQPNRGLEGLAITPDGKYIIAALQGPLIQDSIPAAVEGKRTGVCCRFIEVELATGKTRELLYPLDQPANGISEILAINDHEFLVIERDSTKGATAGYKKIIKADLNGAEDVSRFEQLPHDGAPTDLKPIQKAVFLDLLDPKFGLSGETFSEKQEGLAFGPSLADGRKLLIVGIDNDFVAEQPSEFYAFAIDPETLPHFGWKR